MLLFEDSEWGVDGGRSSSLCVKLSPHDDQQSAFRSWRIGEASTGGRRILTEDQLNELKRGGELCLNLENKDLKVSRTAFIHC